MPAARDALAAQLSELAGRGVWFGTSSWKYPGWFDSIYARDRYVWRGLFSQSRFERQCLAEYAETFPTVSVDASYYQFLSAAALAELAAQVPNSFQFAFKVCGDITLKKFPHLPRFGPRAGRENPDFLNAHRFADEFLARAEPIRSQVGLIMFEFSRFGPEEFERGAGFAAALDEFFQRLPRGWPYGVEIRNRHWLRPEYFALLARHEVTHIFNAWADMPTVGEQVALAGSDTNPRCLAARCLLREGRTYEQAVQRFAPYADVQEPNPEGRAALLALARRVLKSQGKSKLLAFVNNRYEGHAPGTIRAVASELHAAPADGE
jgi:uncharacterized protein YecE (DUF72 family)